MSLGLIGTKNLARIGGYLEPLDSALSGHRLWVCWFILLVAVCGIHSRTLIISPPLWVDEAQIIEHGRQIPFEPNSDWSMNWWSAADRPILLWSYLGPALQETTFRITAPLPYGPRLASLLGAAVAATVLVGWLLSRKTYRPVCLILGLVFLLDPLFVHSYKSARVDCWALACSLASCWLLSHAVSELRKQRPFRRPLMLAGSMASISFFVWASAALTFPLVLAELTILLREEYSRRKSATSVARSIGAFAIGALGGMSLVLAPIGYLLKTLLHDVGPVLGASQPSYSLSLQIQNISNALKFSQLFIVGALIGFVCGGSRWIAAALLFTFVFIFSTCLDLNRLVYLLPYAVGLIGSAYRVPVTLDAKARRSIAHGGLLVLIVASISLSLIVRPAIALSQREARDPRFLFQLGRESVGDGPHRVFLGAWEFYFVGRQLGWHMFHEYVEPRPTDVDLLSSIDHAILHRGEVDDKLAARLSKAGLRFERVLTRDDQADLDLMQRFRIGAHPLGPYELYSRHGATPDGDP